MKDQKIEPIEPAFPLPGRLEKEEEFVMAQPPQREILKADEPAFEDFDITNFEYFVKKVSVLQDQVQLMQRILDQNNLTFKIEARANVDIETKTWELIEQGD